MKTDIQTQEASSISIRKSSTVNFEDRNKKRHLYDKPNKKNKGKGPQLKKRMVF
jgi:ribosomal protein S21